MSDLIERQKAIDAAEESRRLNHHQDGKSACAHEYEHRHFLKILMELPSAEPKWIPVSERLPEDEGWYLVTDDSGGVLWLEVEHYDPEFGLKPFCTVQNPVAWMQMPEPYNGGEQE